MKFSFVSALKFIVFVGIGVLLFYFLFKNAETSYLEECALKGIPESECSLVDKIIGDFKTTKIFWLLVIIVGYMLSNVFRALRWNQMLEPLGYKPKLFNSIGALMIGYFTNMAFPRIGEIIKTGTLSKYENIPFETTMGTVVVDRLLDIIGLLFVIGLALLFSFETFQKYFAENFVMPGWFSLPLLIGVAVVGIIALYMLNKILLTGTFENKLMKKLQSISLGFKDGILSLTKVKNLPLLVLYTIGIWLMYYLMTYLCFFAFKPVAHLGPVAGLVVFVFGTLGMVFPSPGGMGSYHLLISQALVIFGINETDAFSFSNIIFFTINIFGNIIFGLFFFIALPLYNRNKETEVVY